MDFYSGLRSRKHQAVTLRSFLKAAAVLHLESLLQILLCSFLLNNRQQRQKVTRNFCISSILVWSVSRGSYCLVPRHVLKLFSCCLVFSNARVSCGRLTAVSSSQLCVVFQRPVFFDVPSCEYAMNPHKFRPVWRNLLVLRIKKPVSKPKKILCKVFLVQSFSCLPRLHVFSENDGGRILDSWIAGVIVSHEKYSLHRFLCSFIGNNSRILGTK